MFLTGLFARPFLPGDVPGEDYDANDDSDGGMLGTLPKRSGIGLSLKSGGADADAYAWFNLGVASRSSWSWLLNALRFRFGEGRLPDMLPLDGGGVKRDQLL